MCLVQICPFFPHRLHGDSCAYSISWSTLMLLLHTDFRQSLMEWNTNDQKDLLESASSWRRGPEWYHTNSPQNSLNMERLLRSSQSREKMASQYKLLFSTDVFHIYWTNQVQQYECVWWLCSEKKKTLTAATGTSISTKSPAKECLMSLSLTSKKYWAHSYKPERNIISYRFSWKEHTKNSN